jgi:HSP20 family protein
MKSLTLRPSHALRPWGLLNEVGEEMGRLMGDFATDTNYSPAIDLTETDASYVIEADVPGISKDDIGIEISDDVVTIKGERQKKEETSDKNVHRIERTYGAFSRSFQIPGGFEHDAVEAQFNNGVLNVTLPKLKEKQPKRIEVKG